MEKVTGISASPGIFIGKAFLYTEEVLEIPRYKISKRNVENEVNRFSDALEKAKNEIEIIKEKANILPLGEEQIVMLDAHLMMLSDPELIAQVNKSLVNDLLNAEWVLAKSMKTILDKLISSGNQYMIDRAVDLKDVSKRVFNNLLFTGKVEFADLNAHGIIVANDLLPSDAISMDKNNVKGIILDEGGKTSHTAIVARAFNIPAVVGLLNITSKVKSGDEVIVDGTKGEVIISPDEETKKLYVEKIEKKRMAMKQLLPYAKKEAITNDGKKICIKANIEIPEELDDVKKSGASGIGLFRSEFLLLQSQLYANEEGQFKIYKSILKEMGDKPVTVRTLDVGGDKIFFNYDATVEKNPLLGCRGIRYCLVNQDIFKKQIRALYRASVYGNLQIMFPMISNVEELDEVLLIIEEVKKGLTKDGKKFKDDIKIGIMIEIPSAVMVAEFLAEKVDFFSIGTNDLIQYTIAIDRGNSKTAYLYQPYHPALIRFMMMTVEAGKKKGIPVSLCGEIGADPVAVVVLLGLGIEELSMNPSSISAVKKVIRNIEIREAEEIRDLILSKSSGTEINAYVEKWFNERFSGLI